MTIPISVENEAVITRQGKKGAYYKQTAWAYLVDRDGVADPHPSKIQFMLPKDSAGNPVPVKKGRYTLHPASFRVGQYGDLEIGFVNLQPVRPVADK